MLTLLTLALSSQAAPRLPASDDEVLQQVPATASDPAQRRLQALQRERAANPRDAQVAARLVRAHLARLAADADPRDVGQARAALGPWWAEAAPPTELRVLRAVLLQYGHAFDAALADLQAVLATQPGHTEALSWVTAITMVQARYDLARQACVQLAPLVDPLHAVACTAQVDAATGRAQPAARTLAQALAAHPDADPALRLWALTRLAETQERLGDWPDAEARFRQALALGQEDSYLRAAYADFLLDRGRAADVLPLLQGRERNDLLLLRLAIAGRQLKHPRATAWRDELTDRLAAARRHGDSVHEKEEARFLLEVVHDPRRALPLAVANYRVQREAADARVLLQAALAAGDKAAAAPVLQWLRSSRFESLQLQPLAARVEALP